MENNQEKELRIGNYVLVENIVAQIEGVHTIRQTALRRIYNTIQIHTTIQIAYSNIEDIDPIKLTEKWLLDFGFKFEKSGISGADKWQGMDFWEKGELCLRGKKDCSRGLKLSGYFNTNIQFVHQLQNLYYAIEGKELIKP